MTHCMNHMKILEYFTIYKPANFSVSSVLSSVFWSEVKWNKKVRQNQYHGNFRKKHLAKNVLLKKNFYFHGGLFLLKLFTVNNNNKGYFLNHVVLFISQASPGISCFGYILLLTIQENAISVPPLLLQYGASVVVCLM